MKVISRHWTSLRCAVCVIAWSLLASACSSSKTDDASAPLRRELEQSWKDLAAAGNVIWDATADFFVRHNTSNQVTVVALRRQSPTNDPSTIIKYENREYAVLLLPVLPGSDSGWCTFAEMYNHRVLDSADQYALSGQPQKALEVYRLLEHFNCCQATMNLSRRQTLAQSILNGVNVAASMRELSDMRSSPAASVLAQACPVATIPTTNLLGVTVQRFSKR